MYQLPITYKDMNDDEITEVFCFNMSTPELVKFEDSKKSVGGMKNLVRRFIENGDAMGFVGFVEELVKASYGVKSEDNKRFIKSPELTEEFMQSNAYEVLYLNLLQDETAADKFIASIMPTKVRDAYSEAKEKGDVSPENVLGLKPMGDPIKA